MMRYLFILYIIFINFNLFAQDYKSFLLEPNGKYSIGTTELFLTDSSRKEMIKKSYKGFRRIYVKVWYPSDDKENLNYSNYFSNYNTKTVYDIFKIKKVTMEDIDSIKQYYTHSCSDIKISKSEQKFPIIIFNAGFYFGMTDLYSNYMELLASNGYIVFSVIHPYQQPLVSFPDGEAKLFKKKAQLAFLEWKLKERIKVEKITSLEIQEEFTKNVLHYLTRFDKITRLWTIDNQFVLDYLKILNKNSQSRFYQKLDLGKIGTMGQSIGGAAAGQLSLIDKRIKAGMNLDCFQFGDIIDTDLQTPFMLIESQYQEKWNIGNEYIFSHTKSDYYYLHLLNTTHFITSDAPLLPRLSKEQQVSFYGDVDEIKIINLENKYILDFFNLYLKDISSEVLKKEIQNDDIIYKVR